MCKRIWRWLQGDSERVVFRAWRGWNPIASGSCECCTTKTISTPGFLFNAQTFSHSAAFKKDKKWKKRLLQPTWGKKWFLRLTERWVSVQYSCCTAGDLRVAKWFLYVIPQCACLLQYWQGVCINKSKTHLSYLHSTHDHCPQCLYSFDSANLWLGALPRFHACAAKSVL